MLEVSLLHAMDPRKERLAELRRQLADLNDKGRQTAPGSPEREAVLEEWAPVHAAVLALAEELEGEE
jgi:hypothetical protein